MRSSGADSVWKEEALAGDRGNGAPACDTHSSVRVVHIPVLILPRIPEFDLLFPNSLVIPHLEYLLKAENDIL